MLKNIVTKSLASVLATGLLAIALSPLAAEAGQVSNRVYNQQVRIDRGVRNGTLTRGEYFRDESHLRSINAQRRADLFRDGGRLTANQQANLDRRLTTSSRRIYVTKHNGFYR